MARMSPNGPYTYKTVTVNATPAAMDAAMQTALDALNTIGKPWAIIQFSTIVFSATNIVNTIVVQTTDIELTIA